PPPLVRSVACSRCVPVGECQHSIGSTATRNSGRASIRFRGARMKRCLAAIATTFAAVGCGSDSMPNTPGSATPAVTFFVSSQKSVTGNIGGLRGAENTCQTLAAAIGAGSKNWRAYLSVERDADNGGRPTNARDRIGAGPWVNINGAIVATNLAELHARKGDAAIFLDERGQRINGQWTGSPSP